ncbi:phospholipase D family protein [Oricola cellulosilytica]|uniref:Phospholipase D n=1 Tax=Oricola cellulosilytica TaxID=1429082 RepID=A0A4R0PF61_9HYPH|nr:phospholipase D family protein [Oricola cellulosilytica]TCD15219.1 phospholipase D family protein [Oricola cellulosilytica]
MTGFLKALAAVLLLSVAAIVIARLMFPLPSVDDRQESAAIALSPETTLGGLVDAPARLQSGKSGMRAMADGGAAFASRLRLVAGAEASIDAQYYIWRDDTSGRLLLSALREAAERGVRVRLLLDDNGIAGLDPVLTALHALENFEVRIFNPSTIRRPKVAGYLIDFFRMNRRMHNKALIADGAAAIVGGRNIGDEYFQMAEESHFIDLDVLAAGPVAAQTAANFDLYWNSGSAYPMDLITWDGNGELPGYVTGTDPAGPAAEVKRLSRFEGTAADRFIRGDVELEWVRAELLSDHPAKGLGEAEGDQLMINRLKEVVRQARTSLDLISPYLIPGDRGVAFLAGLRDNGAKIRILTNAYATTDVKVVHAGYAKYRRDLLREGMEVFELKPGDETPDTSAKPGVPGPSGSSGGSSGSSASSLHAKTVALDGDRVFIGSLNLDPRSVLFNTEMGFLIESPEIAQVISDGFVERIEPAAFAVRLDEGALRWREQLPDGTIVHDTEPGTTLFDRLAIRVLGWLPIEWML